MKNVDAGRFCTPWQRSVLKEKNRHLFLLFVSSPVQLWRWSGGACLTRLNYWGAVWVSAGRCIWLQSPCSHIHSAFQLQQERKQRSFGLWLTNNKKQILRSLGISLHFWFIRLWYETLQHAGIFFAVSKFNLEMLFPVPLSSQAVSEKKAFEGLQRKGFFWTMGNGEFKFFCYSNKRC